MAAARRRKNRKREKARERDRTTLPDEATLRIVAPPSYRGREAEMAAEILSLLERREAEHRRERQRKGRGVRGAKAHARKERDQSLPFLKPSQPRFTVCVKHTRLTPASKAHHGSLSNKHFKQFRTFFETMPRLKYELEYKQPKTGKTEKRTLEGMQSFF